MEQTADTADVQMYKAQNIDIQVREYIQVDSETQEQGMNIDVKETRQTNDDGQAGRKGAKWLYKQDRCQKSDSQFMTRKKKE